jgi:hypothetical protein
MGLRILLDFELLTEEQVHQDLAGLRMDMEKLSLVNAILWQTYGKKKKAGNPSGFPA